MRLASSVLLGIASLALCACTTVRIEYQDLPPLEALHSIEPGATTRSEVLARLGPPEEMRSPAPFERARLTSPQKRKVLVAGDVFGRDAYTYARGIRTSRSLGVLPVGPELLEVSWKWSREDRWRIEFDERGVVRSVSHTPAGGVR